MKKEKYLFRKRSTAQNTHILYLKILAIYNLIRNNNKIEYETY